MNSECWLSQKITLFIEEKKSKYDPGGYTQFFVGRMTLDNRLDTKFDILLVASAFTCIILTYPILKMIMLVIQKNVISSSSYHSHMVLWSLWWIKTYFGTRTIKERLTRTKQKTLIPFLNLIRELVRWYGYRTTLLQEVWAADLDLFRGWELVKNHNFFAFKY